MKLFKRTVTLLIFIILISVTCIYFIGFHSPKENKIKDYELKKISALLKQSDIDCSKTIIPKKYPQLPQVKMINALHDRLAFSEKMLDKNFSIADSKTYTNDDRLLLFDNNVFSLTFDNNSLLKKDFSKASEDNYGELIKKGISILGFDTSEVLIRVNSAEYTATVLKTLDGFPVFDCGFKVHYSSGISKLSGLWFDSTEERHYIKHRSLVSVFNEICENTEFSGKKIIDITPGYNINITPDYQKEITAVPVWRITFSDKTIKDLNM